MTQKLDIYKCNVCGNIVEVINSGEGELVCCSVPMEKLEEKTAEETIQEKHTPIVKIDGKSKTIRVGSIPHPMENDHYIIFIEAISPDKKYLKRKYLTPNEEPELDIQTSVCTDYDEFISRALCNCHGLYSSIYKE